MPKKKKVVFPELTMDGSGTPYYRIDPREVSHEDTIEVIVPDNHKVPYPYAMIIRRGNALPPTIIALSKEGAVQLLQALAKIL